MRLRAIKACSTHCPTPIQVRALVPPSASNKQRETSILSLNCVCYIAKQDQEPVYPPAYTEHVHAGARGAKCARDTSTYRTEYTTASGLRFFRPALSTTVIARTMAGCPVGPPIHRASTLQRVCQATHKRHATNMEVRAVGSSPPSTQ